MTLSKQLYIIISFIFFMTFAGIFIINVNNFKEYLEIESKTKSQDTATSLGIRLKPLINEDINDPEIELIISAIGNSGFYKEIRLEKSKLFISREKLLLASHTIDETYKIKDLKIDKKYGFIGSDPDDNILEDENAQTEIINDNQDYYQFSPSESFNINKKLTIDFIAYKKNISLHVSSQIFLDKVLVKVIKDEKFENIPTWFMNLLPLKMTEAKSEISNGWITQAIIYVSANAGDAYAKLYEQAVGAIYYAIFAFIISIILLVVFLRFILQPLKNIAMLAKEISNGKFNTIKKLPWTKELKDVTLSINNMSNKIKQMINKLNSNLDKITLQLSKDSITGLDKEQTFNTDMKQMFINRQEGYILSVKLDNFTEFEKNNSNKVIKEFYKDFADILQHSGTSNKSYRFYGSTFAMISTTTQYDEILELTNILKSKFEMMGNKYGIQSIAHIGVVPFNNISTIEQMLEKANEAYSLAVELGVNEVVINKAINITEDIDQWKNYIIDIVNNQKFTVDYINPALSMDNKQNILFQEVLTSVFDKNNSLIPIGVFISLTEHFNIVTSFDKSVILNVINYIKENNITHKILINISFDSLINEDFKQWIQDILKKNSTISNQIVFSLTSYGCIKDIALFKNFINLVHNNGAKIIVKRFETKFINEIATDVNKQNFIESICELSQLLDIKVLTEPVNTEYDLEVLKNLGIYGSSVKDILKYDGKLTQGVISYCMNQLENNIVNMAIFGKIATITVELLQNIMLYSKTKDLNCILDHATGSIDVTKDDDYTYYVEAQNIIDLNSKNRIYKILEDIDSLDSKGIRKRYRELRRSGKNGHSKGSGIGLYEIAKEVSNLSYEFIKINEEKYNFIFKCSVNSKNKLNSSLDKISLQLSKDDMTNLDKEQTFNTDMKQMFIKKQDGYLLSIKLDNFTLFEKNNSNKVIKEFYKDFADILQHSGTANKSYRFYGSTFAMISTITQYDKILELTNILKSKFEIMTNKYGFKSIAHIGVTQFDNISTIDKMLEKANEAYSLAVESGPNEVVINKDITTIEDIDQWKSYIIDIVNNQKFTVDYINPALSMDKKQNILFQEVLTSIFDKNNSLIPIGVFISLAEQFNVAIKFDQSVILNVIEYIKSNNIKHKILINISFDSLVNDHFKQWIQGILKKNSDISNQIVFSLTSYGCIKDIKEFKKFITLVHKNNAQIILKRFETKFVPLDQLKELKLDYIKLTNDYTNEISIDTKKQEFVKTICKLSQLFNIKVLTEPVDTIKDLNVLKDLGIYGSSIKDILKYDGKLTQGIISYCMNQLETNIINMSIFGKIATISIELLQNMMFYSKTKELNSSEISALGSLEVTKDENFTYFIESKSILSSDDMNIIIPKLEEISSLNSTEIRKRYRELRKSGENKHTNGGGIGFYEIAKAGSNISYKFIPINNDKYYFIFKISVSPKK